VMRCDGSNLGAGVRMRLVKTGDTRWLVLQKKDRKHVPAHRCRKCCRSIRGRKKTGRKFAPQEMAVTLQSRWRRWPSSRLLSRRSSIELHQSCRGSNVHRCAVLARQVVLCASTLAAATDRAPTSPLPRSQPSPPLPKPTTTLCRPIADSPVWNEANVPTMMEYRHGPLHHDFLAAITKYDEQLRGKRVEMASSKSSTRRRKGPAGAIDVAGAGPVWGRSQGG
jgi:hypothetical protein